MIRTLAATLTALLLAASPATADNAHRIHHGDTRTHVNHTLGDHGQRLWGYTDHGARHRVRRYPTGRAHVWIVIDYRVRPHHLRVAFKTRCRWTGDGVECWPGAISRSGTRQTREDAGQSDSEASRGGTTAVELQGRQIGDTV